MKSNAKSTGKSGGAAASKKAAGAGKVWSDAHGLGLRAETRERARKGLIACGDWAVRNQVRHAWPAWDANAGRFPYHVHLATDRFNLSTSWNTARTVQGLLGAWKVLGDARYLEAARWGLEYILSLQYFFPEEPRARGAFIEETPLGNHIGARDGMECTQALVNFHRLTGDGRALVRAEAFLDWLSGAYESADWPMNYTYFLPEWKSSKGDAHTDFIFMCGAIPLLQFAELTGAKKYGALGLKFADTILKKYQAADGSFRLDRHYKSHHMPKEGDSTVFNDDGAGAALICAWRYSREKKYLDAAVAYADWWLGQDLNVLPGNFAMPLCLSLTIADVARATGEKRFLEFLERLAPTVFKLQVVRDERPLIAGAFLGEDMADVYRAGAEKGDFISLRSVSYGLIALGKLAAGGAKDWNLAYSGFGW
ncbi:MAG: hypothetical protein ACREJ2_05250 [Planctomycetota bacterium]